LIPSLSRLPDPRKAQGKQYGMGDIMMGGLSLFLFKEGSRNQMNNHRLDGYFSAHYQQLFRRKLPHQDTVHDVLCALPNEQLEGVKMETMSRMFEQKWLRQFRLLGKYYLVAVDATGIVSFDKPHCEHCLTKTSKNGKTTCFHYVLEAKLVTSDGHALSLATEWIENPSGKFDKQDCERKAFKRLAKKLKKHYPRLPICIVADGLYPYQDAFRICEDNEWKFIFVLQEGSLKTVQRALLLPRLRPPAATYCTVKHGWYISQEYSYQENIDYHQTYTLNWIQCIETKQRANREKTVLSHPPSEPSVFEYVTNVQPDRDNVRAIGAGGRFRWKIENEGFNTQKCGDYELEHKFCYHSYNGLKNYYTLLQIAHTINQLVEKGKCVREIMTLRPKETLRNLWEKLRGYMTFCIPITSNIPDEQEYMLLPAPS
jgi:hypothetical protein